MSFLDLALRERDCEACGATFAPSRSDARTCSPRCRKALSRQRAVTIPTPKRDETPVNRDEPARIRDGTTPPWSDDDEVHDADGVLWRRVR